MNEGDSQESVCKEAAREQKADEQNKSKSEFKSVLSHLSVFFNLFSLSWPALTCSGQASHKLYIVVIRACRLH